MRSISAILILIFVFLSAEGQTTVGSWSDHLSYKTACSVAVSENEVFASTGSSIMIFNKEMAELKKLSPVNGLTKTGISAIAFSVESNTLVIGYASTDIDLVSGNSVYNIPDIARKYIPGEKKINRIRVSGKHAFLACSFGIVVLDLHKKEIFDTWKPGAHTGDLEVFDVSVSGNSIHAATAYGIYSGSLDNQGLSYFGNWNSVQGLPDPAGKYTLVLYAGEKLYVNLSGTAGDRLYSLGDGNQLISGQDGVFNNSIDLVSDGFILSTSAGLKTFSGSGMLTANIRDYGWGESSPFQALADQNGIWIADTKYGLVQRKNSGDFTAFNLPGPASNDAFSVSSYNGKTVITGGGITSSWNNQSKPYRVSVNEDYRWSVHTVDNVVDPMRSLIDPSDASHFFISTWGGGLLEYRGNELYRKHDDTNSPLQTIIPGQPYVRVCGLAMDDKGNVWITQTEVQGSIKILKPDGTWTYDQGLTIPALTIGDMIIGKNGLKWVVLPRGYGLFILNDNGTPFVFDDDRSVKMPVKDNEGRVVANVHSVASDMDGNVWVGTDQGPYIYYNTNYNINEVFEDDFRAFRIKVPRNDGTNLADYMLGTETITSIAVDGANRKWLGTSNSGVYLLSKDGTEQLLHFTEENSPLFSNNISSLSVDNKTGEVWIATSKGIQSYRGKAVEGKERFSGVYAFPNPVREDFAGNVTIAGLMSDSEVKITDVSGNLVYETMSDGGLATWDLTNHRGQRVATGVYVAFCSHPGDRKGAAVKILVVSR